MGVVSGILFGGRTSAPGGADAGDANAWERSGASHYDEIAAGLAVASAGDVVLAGDQAYRVIDDGGTLRAVRPEVYDGTSPTRRGLVNGDEADDSELTTNLGTITKNGTGATAYDGTHVEFSWTTGGTAGRDGVTVDLGFAPTGSTGLYFACRITTTGTCPQYQHGFQGYDGSTLLWLQRNPTYESGAWSGLGDGKILSSETTATEAYVEGLVLPDRRSMIWVDGALVWAGVLDTANAAAAAVIWVAYDNNNTQAGTGSQKVRNLQFWSFT